MLLCTIAPFKDPCLRIPEDAIEATVNVIFRNRELKFQDQAGNTTTLDIGTLRSIEWLSLLGAPYCKLVGLLVRYKNGLLPVAIRIYLNKTVIVDERSQSMLCDTNFLAFESMLSTSIREQGYIIENSEKKRRPPIDFSTKTIQVASTVKVIDELYWSFKDMLFTREEDVVKMDVGPVAIVASITDHWRDTILSNIMAKKCLQRPLKDGLVSGQSTMHIVTKEPEAWIEATKRTGFFNVFVNERHGVPMSFLSLTDGIVISTPDILSRNVLSADLLFTTLEQVMTSTIMHTRPRLPQVNRFFAERLSKKFINMQCPANTIQFSFTVLDNIDDVEIVDIASFMPASNKCLKIVRDPVNTRPRILSNQQASKLMNEHASYMPHFINLLDVVCVPVPKSVLKKFRVLCHVTKNGPIEERITRTFSARYCPIPMSDAIQRFSGRPVPSDVGLSMIKKHYGRILVSLGSFLALADSSLSEEFAVTSFQSETKACSICFDALDKAFSFTICGHVYCNDCCRQQFSEEWSANRSKECAACRTPLLMGDVINCDTFTKKTPFVPALANKESSIKSFTGGLRNHYEVYSEGPRDSLEWPKHVLIPDINALKAADIVHKYANSPHTVNLQVFITANETSQYLQFEQSF